MLLATISGIQINAQKHFLNDKPYFEVSIEALNNGGRFTFFQADAAEKFRSQILKARED